MRDQRHDFHDDSDRPFSVSHLVHTLRRYSSVIFISMLGVMVGYAIVAAATYTLAPAHRVTTVQFRLDFEGADRGEYPNGVKFSPTEVLSTPLVLRVYKNNGLEKYVSFTSFSRSLVVLESNLEMERVVRDYQARLSDPRLTSVERDRIQREYEARMLSVKKGQFALNYMRPSRTREIPEAVVRKALHDILREWTLFVTNEQHVLKYPLSMISPEIIAESPAEGHNPIVKIAMLRSKVLRVLTNIDALRHVPAAELMRTPRTNLSLTDIGIRLEDIIRFRLDPLMQRAAAAGLDDRAETIRFFETQISFDERRLEAQRSMTNATQQTLTIYTGQDAKADVQTVSGAASEDTRAQQGTTGGVVLNDTFIDRLVQLTSNMLDTEYRQRLAEQYRIASMRLGPLQEAAAYDRAMLDFLRSSSGSSDITPAEVNQQITTTRTEVRQLVQYVNDIYDLMSAKLNPTTELLTPLGVPSTKVNRAISIKRLALYGILTFLVALPVIIILCLLHNRVREEEENEEAITRSDAVETTA